MMSALKGRPERQKPNEDALADDATVKITTRLTNAQHRDMKIAAARDRISVEDAYREAVAKYLSTR